MKAYCFKSPGGLEKIFCNDVKDPGTPKSGEIRVAIKANSLNYHDLMVATGVMPAADGRILLSDGAGIVEAVGDEVIEFKPGDKVVSTFFPVWLAGAPVPAAGGFKYTPGDGVDGMATEVVVRSANAFTRIPAGWNFEQAATIPTSALTAWRALVIDGQLKAGEIVLVQGTGGVSMAALQLAKNLGAKVIATSSSNEKLSKASALGADYTINYKKVPDWSAKALEITGGRGVDHVVEVGGPQTLAQSLQAIKVGGHIALVGVLSGVAGELNIRLALVKHARIQGLIVASRRDQQEFVRALETIKFDPLVDKVFPAAEIASAFEFMKQGKHFGKVCLKW